MDLCSNHPGGLLWNWDSPVSFVSLYWWPQRDWSSLQPRLRRASSQTVTRPSCWQCDNPTWSHTAFLSRFHARCRSFFQLHNRQSWLLGGSPVESLQSHFILTMSHCPVDYPFASRHKGPGFKPPGGTYVKPGFSCLRCLTTMSLKAHLATCNMCIKPTMTVTMLPICQYPVLAFREKGLQKYWH